MMAMMEMGTEQAPARWVYLYACAWPRRPGSVEGDDVEKEAGPRTGANPLAAPPRLAHLRDVGEGLRFSWRAQGRYVIVPFIVLFRCCGLAAEEEAAA
jgi:hypothetical protein